jgi:hypothetical protein
MKSEQYNAFAVRLLTWDRILNAILGVAFIAIPGPIESVLGEPPLIPTVVWWVIGALFLLFAAWEQIVIRRPPLSIASLAFVSLMALVPVVLLTAALLFLDIPLNTFGRVILWAGDLLMLLLGTPRLSGSPNAKRPKRALVVDTLGRTG